MESEFKVEITQPGTGPNCPVGAVATVVYKGSLTNGRVFDFCEREKRFSFTVGNGDVIKGWDLGF